ncbi:hypothetical protein CL689_02680 [Candidatus Saccharibacteria bacterium]|nr:hypothetical protein [Candidatus Saccharibacteria bacterium]|tara:strand:+ start:1932 stop:2438 length:507 start_codon:yes stop_codon:yes gene_type:complete
MSKTDSQEFPLEFLVAFALIFIVLIAAVASILADDVENVKGGYAQTVAEQLPESEPSLKALALSLAQHNRDTHQELTNSSGKNEPLSWYLASQPELFAVPNEWFSLLAKSEGIPPEKLAELIGDAGRGPIFTTEAAQWVLEVYEYKRSRAALEAQKPALQALRDSIKQ